MFPSRASRSVASVAALFLLSTISLAQSQPLTAHESARYVLCEVGYPAMPKLIHEVIRFVHLYQEICPALKTMPDVITLLLVEYHCTRQNYVW